MPPDAMVRLPREIAEALPVSVPVTEASPVTVSARLLPVVVSVAPEEIVRSPARTTAAPIVTVPDAESVKSWTEPELPAMSMYAAEVTMIFT